MCSRIYIRTITRPYLIPKVQVRPDAVQSHVMLSRDNKGRPRPLEKKEGLSKKELMTRTAHNNSQTISLLEHRSLEPKYNVRTVQKKTYPGPGGQGGS